MTIWRVLVLLFPNAIDMKKSVRTPLGRKLTILRIATLAATAFAPCIHAEDLKAGSGPMDTRLSTSLDTQAAERKILADEMLALVKRKAPAEEIAACRASIAALAAKVFENAESQRMQSRETPLPTRPAPPVSTAGMSDGTKNLFAAHEMLRAEQAQKIDSLLASGLSGRGNSPNLPNAARTLGQLNLRLLIKQTAQEKFENVGLPVPQMQVLPTDASPGLRTLLEHHNLRASQQFLLAGELAHVDPEERPWVLEEWQQKRSAETQQSRTLLQSLDK